MLGRVVGIQVCTCAYSVYPVTNALLFQHDKKPLEEAKKGMTVPAPAPSTWLPQTPNPQSAIHNPPIPNPSKPQIPTPNPKFYALQVAVKIEQKRNCQNYV